MAALETIQGIHRSFAQKPRLSSVKGHSLTVDYSFPQSVVVKDGARFRSSESEMIFDSSRANLVSHMLLAGRGTQLATGFQLRLPIIPLV